MATLQHAHRARPRNSLSARGRRNPDRARAFPREPTRHSRLRGDRRRRWRARPSDQRMQPRSPMSPALRSTSCITAISTRRSPRPIRRCSSTEDDAHCVKGCYRCLLSYFNQPDHEQIDRTDGAVRRLLLRLARSQVARTEICSERRTVERLACGDGPLGPAGSRCRAPEGERHRFADSLARAPSRRRDRCRR